MITIRNVALSTTLIFGTTAGASAQLPDAIDPAPGFDPDWITLGIATSSGTEEESVHVGEWKPQNLDMIAVQPLARR